MITPEMIKDVEAAVRGLANEFRQVPGLLLTEDDLKCHLLARLITIPGLASSEASADPEVRASAVHAELSWFDENGKLTLKPDLTIVEPHHLSIFRPLQRAIQFPRKGFHFIGNAIVIELKFYRGRRGIPPSGARTIGEDLRKIRRLIAKNHDQAPQFRVHGLVAVFARYAGRAEEVEHVIQAHKDPQIRLIIESAVVQRAAELTTRQLSHFT